MMNFALKMMDYASKMMDFALKMMKFVFKMIKSILMQTLSNTFKLKEMQAVTLVSVAWHMIAARYEF